MMARSLAILAFAGLLAGCQSMPQLSLGGENSSFAVTGELPAPVPRVWPDAETDVLNQRARGYGLVRMPDMQKYLDGLLARIKQAAGTPEWPGRVYVLADQPLTAYATSAGNIYVSWTWLTSAQSEDEIVALLSHEYGHVYLHYHQLEGAIRDSDMAAGVAVLALGIAQRTGKATGWTPVDTLIASYSVGRELASAAWGRSQESAADRFGMNISLRLGYSYEAGFKTLLERVLSWEAQNAKRQEALGQQLLAQVKQQAEQAVLARNAHPGTPGADALVQPFAKLAGALEGMVHQGKEGVGSLWNASTAFHPDTEARLDSLAEAVDVLPAEQTGAAARTEPWEQARKQSRTAGILRNYQLAFDALENVQAPGALAAARKAATGPTANHAIPLYALYSATRAAQQGKTVRGQQAAAQALDRNLASEPDRAWASVVERSQRLQDTGQHTAARKVMDAGFQYFNGAGEAWPTAIAFYGEAVGWPQAKALAQDCARRFPSRAQACNEAAASPADRVKAEREAQEKGKALLDRILK